jgi:hypothetical protein
LGVDPNENSRVLLLKLLNVKFLFLLIKLLPSLHPLAFISFSFLLQLIKKYSSSKFLRLANGKLGLAYNKLDDFVFYLESLIDLLLDNML